MKILKHFRNDDTYLVELNNGQVEIMTRDQAQEAGIVFGNHDGWHLAIKFNVVNKNGRIYLDNSIVNMDELIEKAQHGTLLGELDYPHIPHIQNYLIEPPSFRVVSLNRASHLIEGLKIEKQGLYVKVKTLNTEHGRMLDSFEPRHIVFRPRSTGEVVDGVCKNINVITFDAIPADTDAFGK